LRSAGDDARTGHACSPRCSGIGGAVRAWSVSLKPLLPPCGLFAEFVQAGIDLGGALV